MNYQMQFAHVDFFHNLSMTMVSSQLVRSSRAACVRLTAASIGMLAYLGISGSGVVDWRTRYIHQIHALGMKKDQSFVIFVLYPSS